MVCREQARFQVALVFPDAVELMITSVGDGKNGGETNSLPTSAFSVDGIQLDVFRHVIKTHKEKLRQDVILGKESRHCLFQTSRGVSVRIIRKPRHCQRSLETRQQRAQSDRY